MKNLAIGMIIGVLLSAAMFYPLLKFEQKNKFDFGQYHGFLDGQWSAIESLEPFLGQVPPETKVEVLFSVKTSDIVVYEENGVKVIGLRKWLITSFRSLNNIMPIRFFLPAFTSTYFYSF